jgi:teichoic acid transport system ATP-binding protein
MRTTAIKVENVSKMYKLYDKPMDRLKESLRLTKEVRFRPHYALNEVSFRIDKGETVGIIGTNGAGKSTVLKIITGVLNQTSGNVEINGRISALLELGAGFNMEYTGIENVYLNGTMIGFSKEEIDSKLESILEFADIGEFVYQPVRTYSSGMFVRLAFAVAINIDPEILIVDEALSVGDVFFQAKCYKKFEEFKKEGKTILFVSHDLGSISRYCDRVVLLNHGRKLDEGSPKDMINMYKKVLVNQLNVENTEHIESTHESERVDETKAMSENSTVDNVENYRSNKNLIMRDRAIYRRGSNVKGSLQLNPNLNDYGTKEIEIIDFGIYDDQGIVTGSLIKGEKFSVAMKLRIHKPVFAPIVAFTITNLKGEEISGTNTMYENKEVVCDKPGEVLVVFSQEMNFQGGEYLLSLGCTGYEKDDFTVYHRLYDVCNITVVSDKNTVGFFDMNSEITVEVPKE